MAPVPVSDVEPDDVPLAGEAIRAGFPHVAFRLRSSRANFASR